MLSLTQRSARTYVLQASRSTDLITPSRPMSRNSAPPVGSFGPFFFHHQWWIAPSRTMGEGRYASRQPHAIPIREAVAHVNQNESNRNNLLAFYYNFCLWQRYCVAVGWNIFNRCSIKYLRFKENARILILNAAQQQTFGLNGSTWYNNLYRCRKTRTTISMTSQDTVIVNSVITIYWIIALKFIFEISRL